MVWKTSLSYHAVILTSLVYLSEGLQVKIRERDIQNPDLKIILAKSLVFKSHVIRTSNSDDIISKSKISIPSPNRKILNNNPKSYSRITKPKMSIPIRDNRSLIL